MTTVGRFTRAVAQTVFATRTYCTPGTRVRVGARPIKFRTEKHSARHGRHTIALRVLFIKYNEKKFAESYNNRFFSPSSSSERGYGPSSALSGRLRARVRRGFLDSLTSVQIGWAAYFRCKNTRAGVLGIVAEE